jgi:hypothetical protein
VVNNYNLQNVGPDLNFWLSPRNIKTHKYYGRIKKKKVHYCGSGKEGEKILFIITFMDSPYSHMGMHYLSISR